MKYRAVTCYRKERNNNPEDIYFRVQAITDADADKFRLVSPRYEYSSEAEVIRSLGSSRKPLVLLNGEVVIPLQKNFPKYWEEYEILKPWYPGITESVAENV